MNAARIEQLWTDARALVLACVERALEVELVDRAVALAALTFTALIPLGVVTDSVVPSVDRRTTSDWFIEKFHLYGDSADLVRGLFAPPEDVRSAVSFVGVVLLLVSALSFTRGLQRVYERSWRLPSLGVRGTPAGLRWLLGVVVFFAIFTGVRQALVNLSGDTASILVVLAFSAAIWLLTPWVLLSWRVPWRTLVPSALLTAVGMTTLSSASVIYMPDLVSDSADRYGQIGIAIAIVSWLVTAGFVLVGTAVVGAVLAERLGLRHREGIDAGELGGDRPEAGGDVAVDRVGVDADDARGL